MDFPGNYTRAPNSPLQLCLFVEFGAYIMPTTLNEGYIFAQWINNVD